MAGLRSGFDGAAEKSSEHPRLWLMVQSTRREYLHRLLLLRQTSTGIPATWTKSMDGTLDTVPSQSWIS